MSIHGAYCAMYRVMRRQSAPYDECPRPEMNAEAGIKVPIERRQGGLLLRRVDLYDEQTARHDATITSMMAAGVKIGPGVATRE